MGSPSPQSPHPSLDQGYAILGAHALTAIQHGCPQIQQTACSVSAKAHRGTEINKGLTVAAGGLCQDQPWLKTYPRAIRTPAGFTTACKINHRAPGENTTQRRSSTNRRGAARWRMQQYRCWAGCSAGVWQSSEKGAMKLSRRRLLFAPTGVVQPWATRSHRYGQRTSTSPAAATPIPLAQRFITSY
jgi:hypothetical protein